MLPGAWHVLCSHNHVLAAAAAFCATHMNGFAFKTLKP